MTTHKAEQKQYLIMIQEERRVNTKVQNVLTIID
jgi:hypothetical protein